MIVDASAILAIILQEEDGARFSDAIAETAEPCAISPVNYLECCVRIDRLPDKAHASRIDEILQTMGVEIATVTPEQAVLARQAYQRFGKGRHPARLNLGDCFAYALARSQGRKLLFKGDDFARTDIEAAL